MTRNDMYGGADCTDDELREHRAMPTLSDLPTPAAPDCRVVELRQYTLYPGRRDALIELFDREFVDAQEAQGINVLGQFRDLDDADRFVWLRGFADMAARGDALAAFYGGRAWAEHRDAANATMADSDDVLLLRPAWRGAALPAQARGAARGDGLLRAQIFHLKEAAGDELLALCRRAACPQARVQAWYVTESALNNFPRLPLREGEPVLVGLAFFDDALAGEGWANELDTLLQPWQRRPAQALRLAPTSRSALQA
ncbi:NIPSNAP family protein [Roseateles sp.]|uniref:NIPSNAP family protein n=1 Tax=Roseateles sp. TaxID=1971397 RepID=UPI0039EBA56A